MRPCDAGGVTFAAFNAFLPASDAAHARTAVLSEPPRRLRPFDARVLVRRFADRVVCPLRLRPALIHGSRTSRSSSAFSAERSISYEAPSRPKMTVSAAGEPSKSSTTLHRRFFATVVLSCSLQATHVCALNSNDAP